MGFVVRYAMKSEGKVVKDTKCQKFPVELCGQGMQQQACNVITNRYGLIFMALCLYTVKDYETPCKLELKGQFNYIFQYFFFRLISTLGHILRLTMFLKLAISPFNMREKNRKCR